MLQASAVFWRYKIFRSRAPTTSRTSWRRYLSACSRVSLERSDTIAAAVASAHRQAAPGDVVVLAPACASFDQFKNYEHRGRVFKELVRALAGERRGPHGNRDDEPKMKATR